MPFASIPSKVPPMDRGDNKQGAEKTPITEGLVGHNVVGGDQRRPSTLLRSSLLVLSVVLVAYFNGLHSSPTLLKLWPSRTSAAVGGFKEDPAYGWKDDIWPIRPQQPWDISTDFPFPRKLTYDVQEGTWMRLDVSPEGDIIFDMLGDIYCLPSDELSGNLIGESIRANPILLGTPYDSDPHFSPDGKRLVFRSDAGLGVENIWVLPWDGCRSASLRGVDVTDEKLLEALWTQREDELMLASGLAEDEERRIRRLRREGRLDAYRVTNETYRWVSDARFHPDGKKVVATKWYTSGRSIGAGEGWIFDVPDAPRPVATGDGLRVVARSLPFGWSPDQYPDQQIGPEQFIWWGKDRIIYSMNVAEDDIGRFEYSKDVYSGIYAIFSRNLTTGRTETLVHSSPGGASRPELSRDGRTLAFVRRVRDKEALVLKDLQSGTLHNVWYGLTYDLSSIFAPMGTYPSFAFTPNDDAIIIWADGGIWRVPLTTNSFGERVAGDTPHKINFIATIEKRIAETRRTETHLVNQRSDRVYALKELSVDETGGKIAYRAGASTYFEHLDLTLESPTPTELSGGVSIPHLLPGATYYSPSFVPHMSNLVIQARWSDELLSSLELADLDRSIAFDLSGSLPQGRYDHPVICECEGLNRRIAFVRKGGDYMTGDVVATANPGIYVGSITLPSPFGIPNEQERKIEIRDLRRVSRATPRRLRFTDGAKKLIIHSSSTASVIDLTGSPDEDGDYPVERLARGRMSQEIAVTPRPSFGLHGRLSPAPVENVAFVDSFQVYVADGTSVGTPLWSKPGRNATKGLARVSLDGGHDLAWSGDGKRLVWTLGPYIHSLEVARLDECRSAIQADPSTFGIDCVRGHVKVQEIFQYQQTEQEKYHQDVLAYRDEPHSEDVPEANWFALVVTNATLVTMHTGKEESDVIFGATLVVRNGVIEYSGRDVTIPIGAKIINAEGGIVVPGFVDVHAHWAGADTVASSWEQQAFLAYGCTTMHNPSSDTVDTWMERARVESGNMVGPRIFTTGTIIYGAGEGEYHQDIADEAEAKSALIRLKVEGGPFAFSYKNYQLPARRVTASRQRLLKAAQSLGMNAYPEGGMNFDWDMTYIIDGMTTVEHSIPIPKLYDDVLTLLAKSGTGNTPTHIVNYGGIFGEDYVWAHERLPYDEKLRGLVPHGYLESLSRSISAPKDAYQLFNTSASVYEMTKRGLNANIGAHGEPPVGLNYHEEMWFFSQGGMSPYEVLRSATRSGAISLGLFESIGSLSPGKLADFIIYPPGAGLLQDISSSRDIRYVVKGGRVWDAPTMTEVWPAKGRKQTMPPLNAD